MPPVTQASAQATANRLLPVMAPPSSRCATTSATPPRPIATPSICRRERRTCSQRETTTAVSSGCRARISAVPPAERQQGNDKRDRVAHADVGERRGVLQRDARGDVAGAPDGDEIGAEEPP